MCSSDLLLIFSISVSFFSTQLLLLLCLAPLSSLPHYFISALFSLTLSYLSYAYQVDIIYRFPHRLFVFHKEFGVNSHDSLASVFSFLCPTHFKIIIICTNFHVTVGFFFSLGYFPLHHKQYKTIKTFTFSVTVYKLHSSLGLLVLFSLLLSCNCPAYLCLLQL